MESAFLTMKILRASWALRLANWGLLCLHDCAVQFAKMDKNFLGPSLANSWIFPWD